MRTVYFAHDMRTYGGPEESFQLSVIRKYFPDLLIDNPAEYPNEKMPVYLKHVSESSVLVFSRFMGCVRQGVSKEISRALEAGVPAFEIVEDRISGRHTYPVKCKIPVTVAESVREWVSKSIGPTVSRFCFAGSFRRHQGSTRPVGDLDVLYVPLKDWKKTVESVLNLGFDQTLNGPAHSAMTSWVDGWFVKIELWGTDLNRWPWALIKRTGSNSFNISMASFAKDNGASLSERGLLLNPGKSPERFAVASTESDIFRLFGSRWIPPSEREGYPSHWVVNWK
jgi:DNA polymerase/3'-5' exonuclease PolX